MSCKAVVGEVMSAVLCHGGSWTKWGEGYMYKTAELNEAKSFKDFLHVLAKKSQNKSVKLNIFFHLSSENPAESA